MKPDEFVQPTLGDAPKPAELAEHKPAPVTVNSGKNDELSRAVEASNAPKPVKAAPEPERLPGKYHLDYELDGVAIHETHTTVHQAVARVAALKRLHIVPATSTVE